MRDKAMPAIAREYSEQDRDVSTKSTVYNTVSLHQGLGDSGRKIEITDQDCPACSFEKTLREHRVNPTMRDSVQYYCLNPVCKHYVSDTFSYIQSHRASEPTVSDDTDE